MTVASAPAVVGIPDRFSRYIGIPYVERGRDFDGADCWAIPILIYREELGVDLPHFGDEVDPAEQRLQLLAERELRAWIPVQSRLEDARAFDVLDIRSPLGSPHTAVVVAPGWMIHTRKDRSRADRFFREPWPRLIRGVYRHPSEPI